MRSGNKTREEAAWHGQGCSNPGEKVLGLFFQHMWPQKAHPPTSVACEGGLQSSTSSSSPWNMCFPLTCRGCVPVSFPSVGELQQDLGEAPRNILMAALHYVLVPWTQDEFLVLFRAVRTCVNGDLKWRLLLVSEPGKVVLGCALPCVVLRANGELKGHSQPSVTSVTHSQTLSDLASANNWVTLGLFHYSSWSHGDGSKVISVLMCWMGRCYRLEIEPVTPEWFSLMVFDLPLILIAVLEGQSQRCATR